MDFEEENEMLWQSQQMELFKFVAGAFFVLVSSFLTLKVYQKMMIFLSNDKTNRAIQNLLETSKPRPVVNKQRKRRIICKSKSSSITFKPKFKNKESAPKLVYMVYIFDSSTIVFFSNNVHHHASETKAHPDHINATRIFDMKLPEEGIKYVGNFHLHCKGLFVFPHATNTMVCNPNTKEVLTLPQGSAYIPRLKLKEDEGFNKRVAFGFIQPTQTYKLAQFFYRSYDLKERRYSIGFEVFTIGMSKSWRVLAKDPPYPLWDSCCSNVGRRIYFTIWYELDLYGSNAFLCFDLKNEKFSILYPPYSLKRIDVRDMPLRNLGGRLCLSSLTMNCTRFELFTSKQGNNIDWTLAFCFNIAIRKDVGVFPVAQYRGKLLARILGQETNRLDCYNVEDGSCEEVKSQFVDFNVEGRDVFDLHGKLWYYVSSYEESPFKLEY